MLPSIAVDLNIYQRKMNTQIINIKQRVKPAKPSERELRRRLTD